ncbi:phosphoglycerate mutase family protein [Shewanella psychrotolerans]|uniref:phosphoglycerate mutase family protein n=1 Tax=Shewanella psychrotolerans TaxID=2864206 RepID=UPI001C65E6FE|nr:phosphoglycerate mutase family protein [Shewanella psychrotolerans]QYK02143.1 histidine phosphatase family protein [Shewanella psychrotolerans]
MRLIGIFIIAALCFSATSAAQDAITKSVILVRHAEKSTERQDPSLTEAGKIRARQLAKTLAKTELTLAISTQFARTKETLEPITNAQKIPLLIMPATNDINQHIQQVVAKVKQHDGNIIIAGHSNTVPLIIKALGGPKIPMLSEGEYDNLFIVSIPQNGAVSLIRTQYGASSSNNNE